MEIAARQIKESAKKNYLPLDHLGDVKKYAINQTVLQELLQLMLSVDKKVWQAVSLDKKFVIHIDILKELFDKRYAAIKRRTMFNKSKR
jgi:hypothetical protein